MTELTIVFFVGVIVGIVAHQAIYLGVKDYYESK